jgi:hypothetical protein
MNQSSPSETTQEQPIEKLPCDIKFFSAANKFAEQLIDEIPELQAVAFVPLWAPSLENVPTGLLRLRNETPPYIAGLLQMLGRLTAFGVDVHRDMVTQIKVFDKMAADLVAELQDKSAELRAIQQQINEQAGENTENK